MCAQRFADHMDASRNSMIEPLENRTLLSAGQLDATFSGDGRFSASIPGNITITDGTAQSDGKILAAGTIDGPTGKDLFVARVTADGALDTTFSNDGIATVSIGTSDALDANIAVDASGRIVLAGGTKNSFSVVRFSSNGNLDSSFSGDGIATISKPGSSFDDVAIQSDGKVVGLASAQLFRLTASGDLDTTYGNDGFASMPPSTLGKAVTIGPSDKAVVVGSGQARGKTSWDAIARFNSDGTLDGSFTYDSSLTQNATGGPGYAITAPPGAYDDNGLYDVTVGPDSSIYVTGFTSTEPSLFIVGKFAADGKFQWSDDGISDPFSTSIGQKIALDSDGKVLVGVDGFAYEGVPGDTADFVLLRYDADGTRDASFGQAGTARTDFTNFKSQDVSGSPSSDVLAGVGIAGGKYVAIGGSSVLPFEPAEGPLQVARYDGGNTAYVPPVTTLSDGSIQAVGTDGADQIAGYPHDGWKASSNAVEINGEVLLIPDVQDVSLKINSYGGDDYIRIRPPYFHNLNAQVDSGDGNDIVYSFANASTIYGGDGNDDLSSQNGGPSTIYGGIGQDTLTGSDSADALFGEGGNDYLLGNDGDDHLDGGGGNDSAFGMGGNDQVVGGSGNDRLEGGADNDVLEGQSGADSLYGNAGQDALSGGSDNDLLDGGTGPDFIEGDDGEDTVSYAARNNPVNVSLDDLPNDGESGEQDNVRSSVEDVVGGAGNDTLTGSSANNRIYGLAGDDVIHLGGGNDYAEGGAGNDFIDGGSGTDTLYGNSGDDTLQGDNSADVLDGGTGNNTINHGGTSGAPSPVVLGDDGTLSITGTSGPDQLTLKQDYQGPVNVILNGDTFTFDTVKVKAIVAHLGGGNDHVIDQATANQRDIDHTPPAYTVTLWGEGGDDVFEFPTLGNDFIVTNDTAFGGSGNDRFEIDARHHPMLYGESGDDTVHSEHDDSEATFDGGSGIDTEDYRGRVLDVPDVYVGANVENFYDGATVPHFIHGNDLANHIIGTDQNDTIDGGGGNDTIEGSLGDDSIIGGIGADRIDGGEGDDFISGGGGNDYAVGGIGADIIQGNAGNDTLDGQGGNDAVFGGSGDDNVSGGRNNDYVEGDDGNDHVIGNGGDDSLRGGLGDDILEGDSGNDTLLGEDGVDALFGGSGNDNLDGGANRDYLEGNAGQDTIFGGGGNDTLRAKDAETDVVNGGVGTDTAQVDNTASVKDDVLNIETFIA